MDTSPTNSNARQDLIVYSHQLHHLDVCFVLGMGMDNQIIPKW